jgi:hypothetical protein
MKTQGNIILPKVNNSIVTDPKDSEEEESPKNSKV